MTTDHISLLEQALSSVEELSAGLAPEDWDRPTDLPGWSVKDNLSHLASYEAASVGRPPASDVEVAHLTHIDPANDFAVANEREVEARRARSGAEVLEEFREVSLARLKQLRGLDASQLESDQSVLPIGTMPTLAILPIRVMDVFYHEQDMRRATGNPGHLDGDVARFALERMATIGFPMVVAKRAQSPEGTTVAWRVQPPGRTIGVVVRDGRGTSVDDPTEPSPTFSSDLETLLCLFGGRIKPDAARATGRLGVEGDTELADRILSSIVVIP